MENKANKYISVSYQLYTIDEDGKSSLVEQTQQGRPFIFISGYGVSLDSFEEKIVDLKPGDSFDFTLKAAQAFGEYDPEAVHQMAREEFSINGHFDHEHIFEGAVITLLDSEEHRQMARVTEVTDEHVTLDTNHPLAGETLQFKGLVLENRDATIAEIQAMLNHLSGEGCGCGCDDCDGDCHDHNHDHNDECGCGHCHH